MNIFLCCLQSDRDYPISPYKHWRENFKPPLEAMGHRVLEPSGLDLAVPFLHRSDKRWIDRYRMDTSEQLLRQIREIHESSGIDLFLSYFYGLHIFPDAISEIERMGIPTVNFFCDNLREFQYVSALVDHYTLNWVPEKEACKLYEQRRAAYIHLPMAADPCLYRPRTNGDEVPQITFIGHADPLRTRFLAEVFPSGLPLKVYGQHWRNEPASPTTKLPWKARVGVRLRKRRKSLRQHWERIAHHGARAELRHLLGPRTLGAELLTDYQHALHGGVSHADMIHLATASQVFLGINRCPHPGYSRKAPLVYSRLRDIEAPMMGACYLTEYCEELEDLYDIREEIAVYRSAQELVDQTRRLVRDKAARQDLRHRGHQAAVARHTWERRFERLFDELGLKANKTYAA